ncbi:MAG: phosphatidylserine decarboxylase [Armatimonadota bacterium]
MLLVYILLAIAALWLGVVAFLRRVWFYRDPPRSPESDEPGVIVAPADGRVVYIKRVKHGTVFAEKLGRKIPLPEITGDEPPELDGWAIGIYMSPLDVHFNYCPFPGIVQRIHYTPSKLNLPMLDLWEYVRVVWLRRMVDMFARRYHLENERNTIFLDCGGVKMAVVLIADKFVSKIKCFVRDGQRLDYSEKIGFIERGSQVDLVVLASDVEFRVAVNQQVYGGQTAIARLLQAQEGQDAIAAG